MVNNVVIDPDAPWQANLIIILIVTALTTWGAVMVATIGQRRQAKATRHDVADVDTRLAVLTEQMGSVIALTDQTSRRIDAQRHQISQLAAAQTGMADDVRDVRRDIAGMRNDARADRAHTADLSRRLTAIGG